MRAEGLEPPTFWFEARHSIQLSYARIRQRIRKFLTQVNHLDILPAQIVLRATVAQSVEQGPLKPKVVGSIPTRRTKNTPVIDRGVFV